MSPSPTLPEGREERPASGDFISFVKYNFSTLYYLVMMKEDKIIYKQGFFFPVGGLIFGGFLILVSLSIFFRDFNFITFCIGTTIACIGLLFFSTKGLEIDVTKKRMRAYTKVLGIKTGKELFLNNFKYVTLIKQGYSQSSFTKTSVEIKSSFSTYNLLIVNDTHHLKQFVQSFGSEEEAKEEAKRLSEKLDFNIVNYDPVRTRGRKK